MENSERKRKVKGITGAVRGIKMFLIRTAQIFQLQHVATISDSPIFIKYFNIDLPNIYIFTIICKKECYLHVQNKKL